MWYYRHISVFIAYGWSVQINPLSKLGSNSDEVCAESLSWGEGGGEEEDCVVVQYQKHKIALSWSWIMIAAWVYYRFFTYDEFSTTNFDLSGPKFGSAPHSSWRWGMESRKAAGTSRIKLWGTLKWGCFMWRRVTAISRMMPCITKPIRALKYQNSLGMVFLYCTYMIRLIYIKRISYSLDLKFFHNLDLYI